MSPDAFTDYLPTGAGQDRMKPLSYLRVLSLSLSALILLLSCATKPLPPPDYAAQMERVTSLLDSYRGDGENLEQARIELDSILARSPDFAPAHREYARYYIMAGHVSYSDFVPGTLSAAEDSLQRALELDPNYAAAYVLAGHLYTLQGKLPLATDALDKAEALGSNDPWLHLNRADVLEKESDFEGAVTLYRRVLGSGSPNSRVMEAAHYGVIHYYRAYHRDGEADKAYRELIAYAPDIAWHYGNHATFLLCRMDQPGPAIEQFRLALSKMNYGIATSGLAAALYREWAYYMTEDELAQAAATLEEAESLRPGDPVEIYQSYCRGEGRGVKSVELAVRLAEIKKKAGLIP